MNDILAQDPHSYPAVQLKATNTVANRLLVSLPSHPKFPIGGEMQMTLTAQGLETRYLSPWSHVSIAGARTGSLLDFTGVCTATFTDTRAVQSEHRGSVWPSTFESPGDLIKTFMRQEFACNLTDVETTEIIDIIDRAVTRELFVAPVEKVGETSAMIPSALAIRVYHRLFPRSPMTSMTETSR